MKAKPTGSDYFGTMMAKPTGSDYFGTMKAKPTGSDSWYNEGKAQRF